MIVKLDKQDLISLVKGDFPNYHLMDRLKKYGNYYDNKGWIWNASELDKCSKEELWEIYTKCKKSWSRLL